MKAADRLLAIGRFADARRFSDGVMAVLRREGLAP